MVMTLHARPREKDQTPGTQRGIAATKHAALCPEDAVTLLTLTRLAVFAKKGRSGALVSRRLRRTRIPIEDRISWPSRSSRSSCLVFRRSPGGFKARMQPGGLTA